MVLVIQQDPTPALLLGYKKKGFRQGKFTGFGGKVEAGEKVLEAAAWERAEETGLQVPPV